MKRTVVILLGLAFGLLLFPSCKKEYDCTCIITLSDGSTNEYSENIFATKKNKQKECDAVGPESDFGKTCTVK